MRSGEVFVSRAFGAPGPALTIPRLDALPGHDRADAGDHDSGRRRTRCGPGHRIAPRRNREAEFVVVPACQLERAHRVRAEPWTQAVGAGECVDVEHHADAARGADMPE